MSPIAENEDLDISDESLRFCFSWVMFYSPVDAVNYLLGIITGCQVLQVVCRLKICLPQHEQLR